MRRGALAAERHADLHHSRTPLRLFYVRHLQRPPALQGQIWGAGVNKLPNSASGIGLDGLQTHGIGLAAGLHPFPTIYLPLIACLARVVWRSKALPKTVVEDAMHEVAAMPLLLACNLPATAL